MQFERAGRATHRARRLFLARVVGGSCAFGLAAAAGAALAQGFPNRPIRLIVRDPPGGPLDSAARALAEQRKGSLGSVVVENRPGAGGNIGVDALAKSAPDGYTLGIGAVATHAINPWLFTRIPYDPLKDFAPITLIAHVPNVLVMTPETAARPKVVHRIECGDAFDLGIRALETVRDFSQRFRRQVPAVLPLRYPQCRQHSRLLGRVVGQDFVELGDGLFREFHLSISPNTISILPIIATTSASRRPSHILASD